MSQPFEPFGNQNTKDDDGAVIDSFFIETDSPPDLRFAEGTIPVPDVVEPTVTTRLITGTQLFNGGAGPIQVLPADANRKEFFFSVYSTAVSPGTNDRVYYADDLGKLQYITGSATQAGIGRHGKTYDLVMHTGALFVVPDASITASIEITWTAVTV